MPSSETVRPDITKLKARRDIPDLIKAGVYKEHSEDRWDAEVRSAAAAALRQMGLAAVEPLVSALRDKDERVRRFSARLLGEIGDWRAIEPLVGTLEDGDDDTREAALSALVRIGTPVVDSLIAALGDGNGRVRRLAADGLGQIKDTRVVEPLIGALSDKDEFVRRSAAESLARIKDPRAVEPLIGALGDKDAFVRHLAAEGLGWIGDPRASAPLVGKLGDEDILVRKAAAKALESLGTPAVESLASALGDKNGGKRLEIVNILARIGGSSAVAPLVSALGDEDIDVRLTAAKMLGEIGDTRAVGRLADCIEAEEPMGMVAAVALVRIGQQPEAARAEQTLKQSKAGRLFLLDALELWDVVENAKTSNEPTVLGTCTRCGHKVYGVSNAQRESAIALGNTDLQFYTARYCLKCKDLYCYTCGRDDAASERCPKCWISKSRGFVNPIQFLIDNGEL